MAPKAAVDNINNLIISSTERGSQDHKSLLDCYKRFDKYLTEEKIQRPVVMLADGHSSRFDFKVLQFMRESQINLFIIQLIHSYNRGKSVIRPTSKPETPQRV